jgi:hypothetical protein
MIRDARAIWLELVEGVHIDEVALLAVPEPVDVQDRVERLVEGHPVEVGGAQRASGMSFVA